MKHRATYLRPGVDLSQLDIWDMPSKTGRHAAPEEYVPIVTIRPVAHRRREPLFTVPEIAWYAGITVVVFVLPLMWAWSR